uniref:Uncharacterized protein n=1 Tax=Romanomermis culicivorax TaxID=13658 RepID=A0A915HYH4_ROMCU
DEDDADNSSDGASCSSFVGGKRPNLTSTISKLASFSSPRILDSDCSADNNVVEMIDDF